MHIGRPHTSVVPSLDGEVLVVLAGTRRPLTGREVAGVVKRGSQAGVNRSLRRLVGQGVVDAQEAGAALLYTLNREHLAAPAVEVLAGLRAELLRRLRLAIAAWKLHPVHASLFGSAARGDGDTSSDIDVFIVRPAGVDEDDRQWRGQVEELAREVRAWTGNHLGVSEVSPSELRRLRKLQPTVANELRADAVPLFGPPAMDLLKRHL